MSSVPRKNKKKKQAKAEPVKKKEPEVVTCKLADNDYTGIIREGPLGSQYLDCSNAKYTWQTGIKYEGPFVMSQIEGKGKFEWQDGSSYVGELHGGKRHGHGLFVSKDGVTRYDGQWCMGKRHGEGKLTYNAEGSSFYEGSWKEGKKHGEGKQVWPSGNTYAGQWEDGQMRGQGTMTWHNQGQVETYSGNWEDSQPHGEGTHTWLAPEPQPGQAFKDTTSQQLNNRYKGQWQKGTRHGKGTFYYANGAYYSGEWADHVKHGKGRHVFEDGRIYDGPFENDTMTEFKAPEPAGLNFGNDDNPVRKMIDISDIQMLACPYDTRGLEAHPTSSLYVEPAKILREVYNMLLRSLGDLKETYYRYRVILPVQGEDPFVLSSHQFWLFARDCGLITPTCMVSRLDRHVWWGPRHHIEVAPEDADEVRPLTPRPPEPRRASSEPSAGVDESEEVEEAEDEEASDASLSSSGAGSPVGREASRGNPSVADRLPSKDVSSLPLEALGKPCTPGIDFADESLNEQQNAPPRIHRFRRDEAHVTNIHQPNGRLLFRQFVEAMVRVALARFPSERSLEVQTQRLFKEKIIPHLEAIRNGEKQPCSEKAFDFVADPDFKKVLEEFRPDLQRLFRGSVISAGVDDHHVIGHHHSDHRSDPGNIVRIRHYGDFGAPLRHYHVCARLDKTIRVKDALRLFNACGFLRAMKKGDVPWADLCKQVFTFAGDEDLLLLDEQEREEMNQAQESGSTTPSESDLGGRTLSGLGQSSGGAMGGFGGFGGQSSGMAGFGGLGTSMDEGEDKRHKSSKQRETMSRRRAQKDTEDAEKVTKDKDEPHESDAGAKTATTATFADFVHCDFTISPVQALRLILEVVSPGSVKALYWRLDPTRMTVTHEHIDLLEFAECELILTEFVRLLIRISDLGTRKDFALCERLPASVRYEGFLRHVFFPALRTPYTPPIPADETEKNQRDAAPPATVEEEKPVEGSNVGEEEEEEVPTIKDDELDVKLWPGFDDYSCAEVEAQHAARRWPSGYEHEVADWM